jgi:hypothetical protein
MKRRKEGRTEARKEGKKEARKEGRKGGRKEGAPIQRFQRGVFKRGTC